MRDDDEYLLDGAAGVAACSIASASKLLGAAQPSDGTALWVIAALDAALSALVAAHLSANDKWDAYDEASVTKFLQQFTEDPLKADYDKLSTKSLNKLLKSAREQGAFNDVVLIEEVRAVRHNLFHPKPVARSYSHSIICDLIEYYLILIDAVLKDIPDHALFRKMSNIAAEIAEVRAAFFVYRASGGSHA